MLGSRAAAPQGLKNELVVDAFDRKWPRFTSDPARRDARVPEMTDSVTTTKHDTIRKWAEERGGRPATVRATEEDGHAGILRIDFDPDQKSLDPIDWNEFFRKFDESDLAFLYQDRTKDGKISRFHKFVHRSSH